ncbi:hypothetical protein COL5a_001541 [Colletotrichum fioriniae]|nr:uncharacterized protein COL516b_007137 [Colletotrichum fioriniae]KAJ0302599.1 hypothetical protein COL516b_007137 [Colletotrichum fioriniae]KAJ0332817.1 hypothetical protein COL5a_001541 [Colletotrichum fioriniae]
MADDHSGTESHVTIQRRTHYSPPWADVSIIGIAGSSGSGKSTLSHAIVRKLNLPWVVILSMDSFYNPLSPEESKRAFDNDFDFDAPNVRYTPITAGMHIDQIQAIDFDVLVQCLRDLKAGLDNTTTIYSPHVIILEGIFALHDPRIIDLLDMRFVEPQRKVADIIVPRGIENRVAMAMVVQYIERKLIEKSTHHRAALTQLELAAASDPLSDRVVILDQSPQLRGMSTIIQDIDTSAEDFIFYFDRLACLLIEQALNNVQFREKTIATPQGYKYNGLQATGDVSAVLVLRGGAAFETALKRVVPDMRTGRILIQSNVRTGEPELHYLKLPDNIDSHESVLLIDTQMASGGAALMAVQVLVDHGVAQDKIVLACYAAGRLGVHRLAKVFPGITIVLCNMLADIEDRWVEKKYFRC